jgi:hypothetical protein
MTQERLRLTVTEVSEPRPISPGGAQKFSFKARTPDGREVTFFTFATRLFPHIRLGPLDADVETTTKDTSSGSFTDRKVTQVYLDEPPDGVPAAKPEPLHHPEQVRTTGVTTTQGPVPPAAVSRPAGPGPATGVTTTQGPVPPAAVSRPAGWLPRPDNSPSIEAQTAAKIGGALLAAGTITLSDPLAKATLSWCLGKLGGGE